MFNYHQSTPAPRQPLRAAKNRSGKRRGSPRTALVAMSLALLVGCASNPVSRWFSERQERRNDKNSSIEHGNTYGQSTEVDLSKTYGQTDSTQNYFTDKAGKNDLPQKYLSEARIGMTKVDVTLSGARGTELERDATYRRRNAQLRNKRTETAVREEMSMALIQELRQQQEARRMELAGHLSSRERQTEALDERNERFAEAWAKEQRTIQHEVTSQAEKEFDEAKARTEQLRVIRAATEGEALAAIGQMRSSSRATRARADATIAQLRQESLSVSDKTAARMAELTSKLTTVPLRFHAKTSRLEAQASAVQNASFARSNELNARANATEAQSAEHEYNLMISVARTNRQRVEAENERKNTAAQATYERGITGVERKRADAHMALEEAETEGTKRFGELDAWFLRSKAQVDSMRSIADRDEKVARAEFVKVVAKHTADAMRETNEHQQVLSEAQMKTTISEAETKAAEVHEQIMSELENQTRTGGVGFPGKTTPVNESMDLDVPLSEKVAAIVPNIDPEDIAAFQAALANVLHNRTLADAQFSSVEATYQEVRTAIEAKRDQTIAYGSEQLASADALRLEVDATLGEQQSNIMAELETGRSAYNYAMVEADAFRKEVLADVTDMRAQAKAMLDDSSARVQVLRKEAQVVMDSGEEEVDAIQAELRSTEEQGEAEANRLLVEAASIEKGETALAEQIDAQINAAGQELVADIANLDRQIESSTDIAETNYSEMLAQAESLGLQTEMEIKRLAARNDLEKALAQAEIERLHDVHFLDAIRGDADVERRLAAAQADRSNSNADADAEQVAIQAEADTFSATVTAQRRIAAAQGTTVRSLFNTRIVEVDTDRLREKADALVNASRQRANAETILAEAETAREKTTERMARLVKHQASLQRAAVTDWDSRLSKNPVEGFDSE